MKKRVSKRVEALAIIATLLIGVSTGAFAQTVSLNNDQKAILNSSGYMISGILGNMHVEVGVPSSGLSTLYVRGQTFHDNLSEGDAQPTWMSSQKQTYETNSYESSSSSYSRTGWVAPVYNVLRVRGERMVFIAKNAKQDYGDHLFEFDAFHQTRTGFQTGLNWETADSRDSVGVVFGYGGGDMNQRFRNYLANDEHYSGFKFDENGQIPNGTLGRTQNHHIHIDIDDFQFGGSWVHTLNGGAKLTTVVLGGSQHYNWNRTVSLRGNYYKDGEFITEGSPYHQSSYTGSTHGNTLGVLVALAKSFDVGQGWSLTPRADFESTHSIIYSASENGVDYEGLTSAFRCYGMKDDYGRTYDLITHRNTFRGGATLAYVDDTRDFSLTAMYGHIIESGLGVAKVGSVDVGNAFAGIGGYGQESLLTGAHIGQYFNAEKTFYIGGDYQLTLYKKASNQMASASIVTMF